ncbi:MAG: septum formation initiator family protein [Desulfarculus sp.]|jgi:cell division protein FtsB|nr:MAG: septum formation initiator family protein [Desulfarculus sp.]
MALEPRRVPWWPLILAAVVLLCAVVVFRGAAHLSRVQEELSQAQQTNQRLDQENKALYRQVQRLRGDKAALERAARREMGLVGPDEMVYQNPGAPAPPGREKQK